MSDASFWDNLFQMGLKQPTTLETLRTGNVQKTEVVAASHTLKADEIDAIRRLQSRGFRVIDLDPNLLDRDEFYTPYSNVTLSEITGENLITTDMDGSGAAPCPNPYWRTYTFECPGNFISIEYLPARAEVASNQPVSPLEQPVNLTPQGTSIGYQGSIISEASREVIILDFEAPTSAPHRVVHGSSFNGYFSTFLLTTKNLSRRIRITIGYNSTTSKPALKESTLHLFGGHGVTTVGMESPQQFCITDRDELGSSAQGFGTPIPAIIYYIPLIWNSIQNYPTGSSRPVGGSVVWVEEFKAQLAAYEDFAIAATFDVELSICEMSPSVPVVIQPLRRVARVTCNRVGDSSGANPSSLYENFRPATPIRVSLPPQHALCIRTIPIGSLLPNQSFLKYDLTGYSLGPLRGIYYETNGRGPFMTDYKLKENPWPADYGTFAVPGRY